MACGFTEQTACHRGTTRTRFALVVYLVVSVILDAGERFAFCWFVLPLRAHHR